MKNWIIAALVGGIIIFLWQFVSWTVSGIHNGAARFHPQQNEILNTLSTHFTETGVYLLPTSSPDAGREDMEKLYEESLGKPMASVMYIKHNDSNMVRSMIRGFLLDVALVLLLILYSYQEWYTKYAKNYSRINCCWIVYLVMGTLHCT